MKKLATENTIGVLIMAAGSSRRFGQPKQLVQYKGRSLIRRAVETVTNSGLKKVLVVAGHAHELIADELKGLSCDIIYNKDHAEGIGGSIRYGLGKLLDMEPGIQAVLIVHADQPLVTTEHICGLVHCYRPSRSMIIATAYAGTLGVPVLMDRDYFEELLKLQGDQGGKRIMNGHLNSIIEVPLPHAAVDIDTMDDFESLLKDQ